jgi:aminoglycoside phosphotransferase (APT) family kinase protein
VGRTAEVFAWDDGRILKLFRPDWGLEVARHEAEIAGLAYAAGAPAPRVDEVVTVEGRAGVVYERLMGSSLLHELSARPWRLRKVAYLLAETHARLHRLTVASLPPLHEQLAQRIGAASCLPAAHRRSALAALDVLARPDMQQESLCHGDFHPENVLLCPRGPMVIDWENAALGDPLADVARTLLLMRASSASIGSLAARVRRRVAVVALNTLYMRRYRQLHPLDPARLAAWELPVTAARLSEEVAPEESFLLDRVRRLVM